MGMIEIAKHAAAASAALEALAGEVKGLPPPGFKLSRSIGLLNQLASWAIPTRSGAGFSDAGALSSALEAGLEIGCEGRKVPSQRRGKQSKEAEKAAPAPFDEPAPTSLTAIAERLGRLGGRSRSEEKVAAARANMKVINERRWPKGRRKRDTK